MKDHICKLQKESENSRIRRIEVLGGPGSKIKRIKKLKKPNDETKDDMEMMISEWLRGFETEPNTGESSQ